MLDVSIDMSLSEEAYKSSQDSVKTTDDDSKNTSIKACTLEPIVERRKTSSFDDVTKSSSKDPNISEDKT